MITHQYNGYQGARAASHTCGISLGRYLVGSENKRCKDASIECVEHEPHDHGIRPVPSLQQVTIAERNRQLAAETLCDTAREDSREQWR